MQKRKVISVHDPVFKSHCLLIAGCSYVDAIKYLNRAFKLEETVQEGKRSGCMMSFDKAPFQAIWLQEMDSGAETMGALTHEVIHLVTRLCANRNLPTYPYIDNLIMDEPMAYLGEFYMSEFLKQLYPKKK